MDVEKMKSSMRRLHADIAGIERCCAAAEKNLEDLEFAISTNISKDTVLEKERLENKIEELIDTLVRMAKKKANE